MCGLLSVLASRITGVVPLLGLSVIAVTCLHVYVGLDARGPIVFEDEIGYLMGARYLAGQLDGARIGPMGSYSIGWSVVLVPVALLLNDPGRYYRGSLVLGSVLGGLTIVPVWWLVNRLVLRDRARLAVLVSAATMALPGFTLMAGTAYAESWLRFLFALTAVAAYYHFQRRSWWWSAALGGLAAALYLSHGRFAGAVALTALLLAIGLVRGEPRRAIVGLAAMGSTLALGLWVETRVHAGLYELAYTRSDRLIARVIDGPRSGQMVAALGDIFYATVTTYGTATIGVALVLGAVGAEFRRRELGFATWLAGAAGSVLVLVCLAGGRAAAAGSRLDYIGYGRYIDPVLPLFAAGGLGVAVTLVRRRDRVWVAFGPPLVAAVAIGGILAIYGPDHLRGKPIAMLSVPGLAPWHDPTTEIYPWKASLVAAAVIGPTLVLLPIRAWVRVLMAAALFTGLSLVGEHRAMAPLDRPWQNYLTLDDQVAAIDPEVLWVDRKAHLYARNGYQYWAPDASVRFFDSDSEVPVTEGLVLAWNEWPAGTAAGARRVGGEQRISQALWVLPGPLADRLAADGYLEVPASEPLPAAAFDADWAITDADGRRIRVVVTHAGEGGPWTSIWERGLPAGGTGAVRVRADLVDSEGKPLAFWEIDLAESLFPGDTATLSLPLPDGLSTPEGASIDLRLARLGQGEFGRATLRLQP